MSDSLRYGAAVERVGHQQEGTDDITQLLSVSTHSNAFPCHQAAYSMLRNTHMQH